MSVQFVLGAAGSGKTEYILKTIIGESEKHTDLNYLYVVPEQFTMEAQRDIVTRHPKHGTMNIDAIGLNRLAYRVFDELSVNPGQVLEDFGKSMLIQRILMESRDELLMYGSYMNKPGFIDEMKSMMSELFQYSVDDGGICSAMEQINSDSALYKKLHDVKLIYERFNEHNERDNYIVAEQLVELLAERLDGSEFLRDSHLYFDGFTGFTPAQMTLIGRLMSHVRSVTFAFTIDAGSISLSKPKEYELFRLTKETLAAISKAAADAGVCIEDSVVIGADGEVPYRFRGRAELAALERNLFRYPHSRESGAPQNIHAAAAMRAGDEAEYVASQIRRLVKDEGLMYKDIAVVTGDLTDVARYYKYAMDEYDIPVFIDANVSLKGDPCTDTARAFLAVMKDNFSFDSVFRLLKTGMTGIDGDEIELLENYALKRNLRGYKAWQRDIDGSAELDETRQRVLGLFSGECLEVFRPQRQGSKATVSEYTEELYNFMSSLGIYGKLEERKRELYELEQWDEGDAYGSIYGKLTVLFDKIVTILGDVKMTVREYSDILETGLDDMEIGIVPPTVDRVVVGDITRSRLNHVKVLFFTGVNEGIIPKPAKKGRILSVADRERLEDCGVKLAPSDKTNAYTEQFYIYTNLTRASDEIYLVYRRQGEDGKQAKPSYIIDRIRGIFPEMEVAEYDASDKQPETVDEALRYIVSHGDCDCESLRRALTGRCRKELSAIECGQSYVNQTVPLTADTMKQLYGERLLLSVSRLEKYAECQYKYFIRYGLGLKERESSGINAANIGRILHSTMEGVFTFVRDTCGGDWNGVDADELDRQTRACADRAADEEAEVYFSDSERAKHVKAVLTDIAVRSVRTLKTFAADSDIAPRYFERYFNTSDDEDDIEGYSFSYDNGMTVNFNGVIDRIDECAEGDDLYYSIVDYKSSKQRLDVDKVLGGLQMQLVTYAAIAGELERRRLTALGRENGKVHLGGMFYFTFDNPILKLGKTEGLVKYSPENGIEVDGSTQDELYEDLCIGEMRYTGMFSGDKSVSDRVDRGGISTRSNDGIDDVLIEKLIEANRSNIERLSGEIAQGQIDINPVLSGKDSACKYCDYRGICAFDTKYSGNSYSHLYKGELEGYRELERRVEEGKALRGEYEAQMEKTLKCEKARDKAMEKYAAAKEKAESKGDKATEKQRQTMEGCEAKLAEAESALAAARLQADEILKRLERGGA